MLISIALISFISEKNPAFQTYRAFNITFFSSMLHELFWDFFLVSTLKIE